MGFVVTNLRRLFGSGNHEFKSTQLSFTVTNDFPEKVTYQDSTQLRKAGTSRSGNIYSIGDAFTAFDSKEAALLKQQLVDKSLDAERGDWRSSVRSAHKSLLDLIKSCDGQAKELLADVIAHDTFGFGPFSILLEDSANIEEILVNRPEANIYVHHSQLGLCKTNLRFNSESSLRFMLNRLISDAQKELCTDTPIIDAYIDDGSRLHAQSKPYSVAGTSVSIRLNRSRQINLRNLLLHGTADSDTLAYLWQAIEADANIVVAGAPASGKTSLMLALTSLVPRYNRVIIIEEDTNELMLGSNFINSVNLNSSEERKVALKDQVINALHMRPDRIIVGELRGSESKEVFSAGNLGIPFMTTLHSNVGGNALIDRLASKPMSVEESSLHSLDIAIFMERAGTKRRIAKICEYRWVSLMELGITEAANRQYEIAEVLNEGKVDSQKLQDSKILHKYADRNVISIQKALQEHKRRSRFIGALAAKANAESCDEYIQSYSG